MGFTLLTLHWIQTYVIVTHHVLASSHSEEIDVAASDGGVRIGARNRHGVSIDVADIDVVGTGSTALDLGVCGVDCFANVDSTGPSGRVDDSCCCT